MVTHHGHEQKHNLALYTLDSLNNLHNLLNI